MQKVIGGSRLFFLEMQVYEWIQLLRVNIRVKITLHTRFCFSLVMTDDCTDKQKILKCSTCSLKHFYLFHLLNELEFGGVKRFVENPMEPIRGWQEQSTLSPLEATRVQVQNERKVTRNLWKTTSIHCERAHGTDGPRNFLYHNR